MTKKKKDVLGNLMDQAGVLKYLSENALKLSETLCSIIDSFHSLYPDEVVTQSEAIFPIFWSYIRWAPPIQDLIVQNFDQKEFQEYGGIVSVRIMKEITRILQVDLGIVKVKYSPKQKENKPE